MNHADTSRSVRWLRISYWTGAIVDLIYAVILIFFPGVTQHLWQLDLPVEGPGLMWARYFGAMVLAWTGLLLWADRKPLERRGALVLTCVPLLVGLIAVGVDALLRGVAPGVGLGLLIGLQTLLLVGFGVSCLQASEVRRTWSVRTAAPAPDAARRAEM